MIPSTTFKAKRVTPMEGGCWFCWTDVGNMVFDMEWDTYVHIECIRKVLRKDPEHPEARPMRYLLEDCI
jgi:hypothetical protein